MLHPHPRIAILAHESRATWIKELVEWFPGAIPVVDTGSPSLMSAVRNAVNVLYLAHSQTREHKQPWAIMGEDDILPVKNLSEVLFDILDGAPLDASVLSLCAISIERMGRDRPVDKVHWRMRKNHELASTLLFAMKPDDCKAFADYIEHTRCYTGWDNQLSCWLESNKKPSYVHVPSLVEHRDESSLLGIDSGVAGRLAVSFPGIEYDARELMVKSL